MKSPVTENIPGPLEVIAAVLPLQTAGWKPHFISSNPLYCLSRKHRTWQTCERQTCSCDRQTACRGHGP